MPRLELNILGCGSATTSLQHLPSCQVLNIRDNLFMIDCGEGAQLEMRRMKLKFSRLNHIFISHLHGDHCFGLPGLLSTLALVGKTGSVTVHIFKEGAEQFRRLRAAGVTSYHHNIETSRRFFPEMCTTHTYDDKIRTIKIAQQEGMCVCSGGIIGMGENWDDRLDMAISLAELGIESIPINALMPIKGTALEDRPQIEGKDVLRTIAFFRYINPEANIRLAAGRKVLPENGATAFLSGASATITGDMLTTSGTTIKGDFEILKRLGLSNEGPNDFPPEELSD